MTNHHFHPQAEEEFANAIDYYESCENGLGLDFADVVLNTIENILAFPTAWPILEDDIRRCQTHRFPFAILYAIEPESIYILAVMHLHQGPNYWKDRLK